MSNVFKKIIQTFLILITFLSISGVVFSQNSSSDSISSISLISYPSSPRAGESVTITIFSDSLNLDSAKINWYIDGTLKTGVGSKSITIKNKSGGEATNVKALIETTDGIKKEAEKIINSAEVDLIVEPISYTMPFYKGKPVFLAEGTVKIVAMPDIIIDGERVSSKNLNFKWSKGGTILGSNSGKGKDSIVITSTIPVRDINIGVEVSDSSGNVLTSNSKTISKDTPSVLFYEKSSLLGILYNKAIADTYNLGTKEEMTVVAKPLSFSFSQDTSNDANYVWYVNGNKISNNTTNPNEIILKQTGSNSGITGITLNLNNINKINQYSSSEFNIIFGN